MLRAVYQATTAVERSRSAYPTELAASTGLPEETVTETLRYLEGEGYAEGISLAGDYGITHDGSSRLGDRARQLPRSWSRSPRALSERW